MKERPSDSVVGQYAILSTKPGSGFLVTLIQCWMESGFFDSFDFFLVFDDIHSSKKKCSTVQNIVVTPFCASGLESQPQAVVIALANIQPDNVATQNGVPVTTLSYNLTVPTANQVGPQQEEAFRRNIESSPSRQYLFIPSATAPSVVVGIPGGSTAVPSGPETPISLTDSIIIAAINPKHRDATLNNVSQVWSEALGGAHNVHTLSLNDTAYLGATPPKGTRLRNVRYMVNATTDHPVDEYEAKVRFRELMAKQPGAVAGVWSIPDLPSPVNTTAAPEESTTTGVLVPIVAVLTAETTTVSATAESTTVLESTTAVANGTVIMAVPVGVGIIPTSVVEGMVFFDEVLFYYLFIKFSECSIMYFR